MVRAILLGACAAALCLSRIRPGGGEPRRGVDRPRRRADRLHRGARLLRERLPRSGELLLGGDRGRRVHDGGDPRLVSRRLPAQCQPGDQCRSVRHRDDPLARCDRGPRACGSSVLELPEAISRELLGNAGELLDDPRHPRAALLVRDRGDERRDIRVRRVSGGQPRRLRRRRQPSGGGPDLSFRQGRWGKAAATIARRMHTKSVHRAGEA